MARSFCRLVSSKPFILPIPLSYVLLSELRLPKKPILDVPYYSGSINFEGIALMEYSIQRKSVCNFMHILATLMKHIVAVRCKWKISLAASPKLPSD